jgi:hypothetical protein
MSTIRTCTRNGCRRRVFMDTDRCFDHQRDGRALFGAWFAFCALIALALIGVELKPSYWQTAVRNLQGLDQDMQAATLDDVEYDEAASS